MSSNQQYKSLREQPIALIGMASIFPQAKNLQEYWENIINKVDCITDVPLSRWNPEDYYDPNPRATDKTYCKKGGFIPDVDFNPLEFGIPPKQLEFTDVSQLLALIVAKEALEDAGYGSGARSFNRERVATILGVAVGRQLGVNYSARMQYPIWEKVLKSSGLTPEKRQKIIEKLKTAYVEWNENSFPGMLANVVAGRIANRLDLGGTNCTLDAACASSLAALKMAVSELLEHRADMVITGGVDTDNSIFAYLCFSKTPALSPTQQSRPFDVNGDGMMLGEGIGMVILKRLEDAERDGDRIYAVIKGIGTSSDGRYKSIYAPRPEGQIRALRQAYEEAGISPQTVGLLEAHGTGTFAGDPAEFASSTAFFADKMAHKQSIALGSVKSQIGHTKAAAGIASLIKASLSLHHKVLPPTINITQPNPKFKIENSPFYLNTETRPWIQIEGQQPRRSGVSSFGFGGTNFHVILEEYCPEQAHPYRLHRNPHPVLLVGDTPQHLIAECEALLHQLQSEEAEQHYLHLIDKWKQLNLPVHAARVGFVAANLTEVCQKLKISLDFLKKQSVSAWEHPLGIYYRPSGTNLDGRVVALFSGQGSQYLNMGREICVNFPCLRQTYSYVDSLFREDGLTPLSQSIFPPPAFEEAQRKQNEKTLQQTEYAQPAIGALSVGLYKILQQAGLMPNFVAGHSFGELTSLWAAQVLSDQDYFYLVKARGQAMSIPKDRKGNLGTMIAVKGDISQVKRLVSDFPQVLIANVNSPQQVVLAGTQAQLAPIQNLLEAQDYSVVPLPVSAAFHTSLVAHAQQPFAQALANVDFKPPQIPVYTNITGQPYDSDPQKIKNTLKNHLLNPVNFQQEIENIYAAGGYCFLEIGPRRILTNFVSEILGDRPHVAIALNGSRQKDSDRQLREAIVQLQVAGMSLNWHQLDPYSLDLKTPSAKPSNTLTIRLNSSNYLSEETKIAFQKALENGHHSDESAITQPEPVVQVSETFTEQNHDQNGKKLEIVSQEQPKDENSTNISTSPSQELRQVIEEQTPSSSSLTIHPQITEFSSLTTLEKTMNYSKLKNHSTSHLTQLTKHQGEMMQIHRQYLNSQLEHSQMFYQLMQQQHQHQAEILRVHEQYLNHYAESLKNLLYFTQEHDESQEHSEQLIGNNNGQTNLSNVSSEPDSAVMLETFPHNDHHGSSLDVQAAPSQVEEVLRTDQQPKERVPSNPPAPHQTSIPEYPSDIGQVIVQSDTVTPSVEKATDSPFLEKIDLTVFTQTLLEVVSEKTGYPPEMLESDMDLEADLGIDSIKRVEILSALQEKFPDAPEIEPEILGELRTLGQISEYISSNASPMASLPSVSNGTANAVAETVSPPSPPSFSPSTPNITANAVTETVSPPSVEALSPVASDSSPIELSHQNLTVTISSPSVAESADSDDIDIDPKIVSQILLEVVSDKTGYPPEMLELDMDLEADLGIDSIKRVEILSAMQEKFPNAPEIEPELLGELRTLDQIIDQIKQLMSEKKNQQPSLMMSSLT